MFWLNKPQTRFMCHVAWAASVCSVLWYKRYRLYSCINCYREMETCFSARKIFWCYLITKYLHEYIKIHQWHWLIQSLMFLILCKTIALTFEHLELGNRIFKPSSCKLIFPLKSLRSWNFELMKSIWDNFCELFSTLTTWFDAWYL